MTEKSARGPRRDRSGIAAAAELAIVLAVAVLYAGDTLLDLDPTQLQQTGEHNESATLPLLAEIGLARYGEIPLWNPYMLTGFPHAGDLVNHFWHPPSTLAVWLWGGIDGMKISAFLAFLTAGVGQWWLAHVVGLRGAVRLWVSLLFLTSGGLGLLWHVGWYELLLGAAWFPSCFAAVWWALPRTDPGSTALASCLVAMALSTGGGYYPFYLLVGAGVLVVARLAFAERGARWTQLRRAIAIAVLAAGLLAVMLLPLVDGYRYTKRQAPPDPYQVGSQEIPYALINYVVAEKSWMHTQILGNSGGWNWFYIGALPLAALALLPLALASPRRRREILAFGLLLAALLVWHANRHTPVRHLYEWFPFLMTFRFPGRLLIVATSPLLVLAGLGLQDLVERARPRARAGPAATSVGGLAPWRQRAGRWLVEVALLALLFVSCRDVYATNKAFTFAPGRIDPLSFAALEWLRGQDRGPYYTQLGSPHIWWGWTPAAYLLEMPVINFEYNRIVRSAERQRSAESPFAAAPRYLVADGTEAAPAGAVPIWKSGRIVVWRLRGALPFAFAVPTRALAANETLGPAEVTAIAAEIDGPNRVVARGVSPEEESHLVVLVSDYPGWRLEIDGRAASLAPVNGYLGARMPPGEHIYTYSFGPRQHFVGLAVSLGSLAAALGLLLIDARRRWRARTVAGAEPASAAAGQV